MGLAVEKDESEEEPGRPWTVLFGDGK